MEKFAKLNDDELDNVSGGALIWEGGVVTVKNGDPNLQYAYTDYSACKAWLAVNWRGNQTESCLQAMEAAGLVYRI